MLLEKYEKQHQDIILTDRLAEAERYKRRWCLRLYGAEEQEGEDVKQKVPRICQKVALELGEKAMEGISVAHRLGSRENINVKPIIILFALRSVRDVWKKAKLSTVLKEKKLRFGEDLTKMEKEASAAL